MTKVLTVDHDEKCTIPPQPQIQRIFLNNRMVFPLAVPFHITIKDQFIKKKKEEKEITKENGKFQSIIQMHSQ